MEKNLQIQKTSPWSLILICSIIFESLFRKKNKKWHFINQVRVSSKAALKHALESCLSVVTTEVPFKNGPGKFKIGQNTPFSNANTIRFRPLPELKIFFLTSQGIKVSMKEMLDSGRFGIPVFTKVAELLTRAEKRTNFMTLETEFQFWRIYETFSGNTLAWLFFFYSYSVISQYYAKVHKC